jgi:bifunctional DNA-binding transcriptional regulator/antitoxin component of YhaV-PrlF toxin-antitoxin module
MSATIIAEKGQTTLPADVSEAAGLKPGDQIDWRFEEGEIRGRKVSLKPRRIVGKLVQRGDALVLEAEGFSIDPEGIAAAVREERDRH